MKSVFYYLEGMTSSALFKGTADLSDRQAYYVCEALFTQHFSLKCQKPSEKNLST